MSAPKQEIPNSASAKINLTARELADILWLMVQMELSSETSEVSQVSNQADSQKNLSSPQNTQATITPENVEPVEVEAVEVVEASAPIYADSPSSQVSDVSQSEMTIPIPDPLALRNALALERSLRALMRKVPSLTETVLDEEATVINIAEEDLWLPVFVPVASRWLEIALVIEITPRYPLWQQTLKEFQQLLERHSAFRNVTLWYLKIDDHDKPQLYSKNRQASFKELNDPSGRRLIWIVSDCVSAIWHNGSLLKELRKWGRMQPVSLLQLLPERLWQQTALGWGIGVKLYSENPGVANNLLLKTPQSVEIYFNSPQKVNSPRKLASSLFTLPIVTLESFPLKNWAKVLAGVGGSKTPGLVFYPEEITSQNNSDEKDRNLSAKARVSRFRAAASPLSRQLAQMMAAAPVSLPVIRLIQKKLLPDSNTVHLAEVFMGGLLKPTTKNIDEVTQEVNYEFYSGVRQELIKITRKSKTFDVISCLSEFVDQELRLKQSVRTFNAILFHPDVEIEPDYLPFARITAETLQLLGGKYVAYAEKIQQKIALQKPISSLVNLEVFTFETVTVNRSGKIINRETKQARFFTENIKLPSPITRRGVGGEVIPLEMVYIPDGTFIMGTEDEEIERLVKKFEQEYFREEKPQHEVTVPAFFMGKYQVTQEQWKAVANLPQVERELKPNPSEFKGDNLPVEQVSWYDAEEFCKRLSKHKGKQYRLASEAEWEYACRAGTTTPFHFGETITSELANYDASRTFADESKGEYREKTTPVRQFHPNAFGLYDMHGNVWEWCLDDWHDNYENAPTHGSAWAESESNENNSHPRVLRSGSWFKSSERCRSACRSSSSYHRDDRNIGFRVVCGVSPQDS